MKRSSSILLGTVFLAAIISCSDKPTAKDEWITGADQNGRTRDTLINNQHYRHYGTGWFMITNGMINPGRYQPSTLNQIRTPGHIPAHIRTGGFGSTGHGASASE